MGRWGDWDAIEAAQAQAAREDRAKERQRRGIRLVTPNETAPEPIEASETVLGGLEESSPVTAEKPVRTYADYQAERAAELRRTFDPVEGLRAMARQLRRSLDERR